MNFDDTDEPIDLGEPDKLPMYNQAVNIVNQLRSRVAELEAENEHLKKSQKITIHPPAITESEVIKHLQDFLKAEREERFRLEAEVVRLQADKTALAEQSNRFRWQRDKVMAEMERLRNEMTLITKFQW